MMSDVPAHRNSVPRKRRQKNIWRLHKRLGRIWPRKGWGILYGGRHVGGMGALAQAALAGGGWVIGVSAGGRAACWVKYPASGEEGTLQTRTLEERKSAMVRPVRGAVALPGGWGTLDEIAYVMRKPAKAAVLPKEWLEGREEIAMRETATPVVLFHVNCFYDGLAKLMQAMCDSKFAKRDGVCHELREPQQVTDYLESLSVSNSPKNDGANRARLSST
jgi:hypothetical protein